MRSLASQVIPWFIPGVGATLVVSWLIRRRVADLLRISPGLAVVLLVSFGGIVSATLTPLNGTLDGAARIHGCDFSRVGLPSLDALRHVNGTSLNVLLFIPLGIGLGLFPRSTRKAWLIGAACAFPFVIETVQLLVAPLDRACESGDVVDNVLGLVIGLGLGTVAGWMGSRRATAPR